MFLMSLLPMYPIWVKNKNFIINGQTNQILHILICFIEIMMFYEKEDLPKNICKWKIGLHALILRCITYGTSQVGDNRAKLLAWNSPILHASYLWTTLFNQPNPTTMSRQIGTLMNKKGTYSPNTIN